MSSLLKRAL
jgi:hypothetical protein